MEEARQKGDYCIPGLRNGSCHSQAGNPRGPRLGGGGAGGT